MRKLILQSEQILVPGEYNLGNKSILQIYFRVFERGHGKCLPPVLVVRGDLIGIDERKGRMEARNKRTFEWGKRYDFACATYSVDEVTKGYKFYEEMISQAPYHLIDGNHRTAAATLNHKPIYALELRTNEDLIKVRELVKRGELFNFERDETDLRELAISFEEHILGEESCLGCPRLDELRTVRQRIDELTTNDDLLTYMKERYLRVA